MRFVCDEMLKRLGHWLRVAGYDVLILPDGSDDRELIARARDERRLLLSSDRRLAEHQRATEWLVRLDCQGLDECAMALGRQLPIDWLYRPFSRGARPCACNWERLPPSPYNTRSEPPGARSANLPAPPERRAPANPARQPSAEVCNFCAPAVRIA